MKFEIFDAATQKSVGSCKADTWLEAVQFIEQTKETYLQQDITEVKLVDASGEYCPWKLTSEVRSLILKDKNFALEDDKKKKGKKKKDI
jgi:N-acetylmuramoyl-L-alanine amidase CwlA